MSALGPINTIKALALGYQPLLLAVITLKDSLTAPTVLYYSSHNLNTGDGGFAPTGITGFPYNGTPFQTRIANQNIAATQALSDIGIDVTPNVTLDFADADKAVWAYESTVGFKGATLVLYYIFWQVGTGNFSTDYKIIFTGVCDPAKVTDKYTTVTAVSQFNMNQQYLPTARIQKNCLNVFPDTTGMTLSDATLLHIKAASDSTANVYTCGYSPLATSTSGHVGNLDPSGNYYRSCPYTRAGCIDRLGNVSATGTPNAPIEADQAGNLTGRYSGSSWDEPTSYNSKAYGSSKFVTGWNASNASRFNDFIPMGWGTFWGNPIVMNIVGDANYTDMEVLLQWGQLDISLDAGQDGKYQITVVVNDIQIQQKSPFANVYKQQISLQMLWAFVNDGQRTGRCDREPIYGGANPQGDPYGNEACILVKVPSQLTPSSSIPTIQILQHGAIVSVYSTPTTFTKAWSESPAWIIMDILQWAGWDYSQMDIQTFLDADAYYSANITYNEVNGFANCNNIGGSGTILTSASGANFQGLTVGSLIVINGLNFTIASIQSPTQLTFTPSAGFGIAGVNNLPWSSNGSNSHARFTLGFQISQRTTVSDILRQVRETCRTDIIPSSTTGLLQIFPRQTLASQQPAPIDGSNFNTELTSILVNGAAGNGYVAYYFNESNIKQESNGDSSLQMEQLTIKDSPNRLSMSFLDGDNQYQTDSISLVDSQDVTRVGHFVDGSPPMIGCNTFDQAQRALATYQAENYRGNPRLDTSGTYIFRFKTTFQASHLRIGQIVLFSWNALNLQAGLTDVSSNPVSGCLCRITAVQPTANFEEIAITMKWHNDDIYVDSYEQDGFQLQQPQFRHSLTRPALPWFPWFTQPIGGDALYPQTDWQFGISQAYSGAKTSTPLASITITGNEPINTFSQVGLAPPQVGIQGTTANTGGTIPGGCTYYFAVCGVDSAGNYTTPSNPNALCSVVVPAGTNTNTVTIPINNWPGVPAPGTAGYALFGGPLINFMSFQTNGTVTPPALPVSITLTHLNEATWGLPDVEFNSLNIYGKPVRHMGTVGTEVVSCTSTTITLAVSSAVPFTVNQFAPDGGGFPYYAILLGLAGESGNQPLMTWGIASNTATTITLQGGGIDPTTISRGDGTFGLQLGDVIGITMRPTVGSDSGGNYVSDPNWVNALNPLGPAIPIAGVFNSGATIGVSTTIPHNLITGDRVDITGVLGPSIGNGLWYVSVTSTTQFTLFFNPGPSSPAPNFSGAYIGGGQVQWQDQGLAVNAEIGNELFIAFGTGAGTSYKILSNTNQKIYIVGDWTVTPDETSVMFVLNPNWEFQTESPTINNSVNNTAASFTVPIPNYQNQLLFFQAFTADSAGNESFRALSPWRIIWAFGAPGQNSVTDGGGFVVLPTAATVLPDIAQGINFQINLTGTQVTVENPIYTGGSIVPGMVISFKLVQDSSGYNPTPAWGSAFAGDVTSQTIDGIANTYSSMNLMYHSDNLWHLASWVSGV